MVQPSHVEALVHLIEMEVDVACKSSESERLRALQCISAAADSLLAARSTKEVQDVSEGHKAVCERPVGLCIATVANLFFTVTSAEELQVVRVDQHE